MMKEEISRKEFLKRGAMTVIALSGITACGRLLSGDAFAAGTPEEINVGKDRFLLNVSDLASRKAASFSFNGKKAILLYNEGQIRAFENICTHQGGPTKLTGKNLVCQWHGARFNPLTGESIKLPAPRGSKLTEIKLDIKAEKIFLAV